MSIKKIPINLLSDKEKMELVDFYISSGLSYKAVSDKYEYPTRKIQVLFFFDRVARPYLRKKKEELLKTTNDPSIINKIKKSTRKSAYTKSKKKEIADHFMNKTRSSTKTAEFYKISPQTVMFCVEEFYPDKYDKIFKKANNKFRYSMYDYKKIVEYMFKNNKNQKEAAEYFNLDANTITKIFKLREPKEYLEEQFRKHGRIKYENKTRYSKLFKTNVVRDRLNCRKTYKELSTKYGIRANLIQRWVSCYLKGEKF